ncbi:MAG: helix-turn-helix domain-containing protein [Bacteroidales bacterium]|nr:helix-turn-helix domain-containing protein [Bacteroidales bacterium]
METEIIGKNNEEVKRFFSEMEKIMDAIHRSSNSNRPLLYGEQYLTNRDVSEKLHISLRTLQDYRDTGKLPFIKLDGKILYKASDINRLLEENYYPAFDG